MKVQIKLKNIFFQNEKVLECGNDNQRNSGPAANLEAGVYA